MQLNASFRPLLMIAAVTTLGASALTAPALTQAGLSASFGAANLYLFRGLNFSGSAPQVHGSLDYEQGGFYAGIWGSSESSSGQEYDLYGGFKGEVGNFSYNFNLTAYEYPQAPGDGANSFGDASEVIISLGTAGFSFSLVDGLNSADYKYYSFAFDTDQFGILLGIEDRNSKVLTTPDSDYTHLDLNFYATDELTFTLSSVVDDSTDAMDNDALFVVNWSKSFDL